ncbi:MAG TPA: hypothetical protein DD670_15005 [Planctomycetaceae bacterium]|nr:hypothetical protein [Planctomycetaceae bacterium]
MSVQRLIPALSVVLAAIVLAGCGRPSTPDDQKANDSGGIGSAGRSTGIDAVTVEDAESPTDKHRVSPPANREIAAPNPSERAGRDTIGPEEETSPTSPPRPPRRTLADLLDGPADATDRWMENAATVKVDDARVAAAGVRRLDGRHLTLYTDFPSDEQTDSLPAVFDLAFPQWCEYFEVDPAEMRDWRLTGFLIRDRERFRRLGLLPDYLPPFQYAFCINTDFWIYQQPGEYYGRHLVLHEGTHCFMNRRFGACGPPWYMEGIAELLSTHRWADGRLTLNYVPRSADEVPMLGRVKLVKDAMAAGRTLHLEQVLALRPQAYLETEPYAWSWAAALFLDRHPRWGDAFRRMRKHALEPDLTERFVEAVDADWPGLEQQWRVFLADLEYGCDPAKMLIDPTRGKPIDPSGAMVEISAQRGWQNSGLRVERGKTYRLTASGRYQIADEPKIWWCEPNGVTIRYYRGRPLGMLLAAVLPSVEDSTIEPGPPEPIPVGLETTLTPKYAGTLLFKINESAGDWHDNRGGLKVEIGVEP